MNGVHENTMEKAALGWFEFLRYDTRRGAEISPGADAPWRDRYEDVFPVRKRNGTHTRWETAFTPYPENPENRSCRAAEGRQLEFQETSLAVLRISRFGDIQ